MFVCLRYQCQHVKEAANCKHICLQDFNDFDCFLNVIQAVSAFENLSQKKKINSLIT